MSEGNPSRAMDYRFWSTEKSAIARWENDGKTASDRRKNRYWLTGQRRKNRFWPTEKLVPCYPPKFNIDFKGWVWRENRFLQTKKSVKRILQVIKTCRKQLKKKKRLARRAPKEKTRTPYRKTKTDWSHKRPGPRKPPDVLTRGRVKCIWIPNAPVAPYIPGS